MGLSDWTRWTHASIADVMQATANACGIASLIEPVEERTKTFMEAPSSATVRITGPFDTEFSKGYHVLRVDINVLLNGIIGGPGNGYDMFRYSGAFVDALSVEIPVYNYGNQPGDYIEDEPTTLVQIGCLRRLPRKAVNVFSFGQVEVAMRLAQMEVSAQLYMEVQE